MPRPGTGIAYASASIAFTILSRHPGVDPDVDDATVAAPDADDRSVGEHTAGVMSPS